jgi:DNA methyltransferase 1-associated protein 1
MSEDVKQILDLKKRDKKAAHKKKPKEEKKRPEGVNREVFSLTNGIPPLMGTTDATTVLKSKKRALNRKVDKWVWTPFDNPARNDQLKLSHWQKAKNVEEPYPFAKINHKIKLVKFSDEEYDKLLKNLNPGWTKEETTYLWDMCELYDLRFIVIHDRYDKKYERTVEELKDRYYTCAKKL